MMQFMLSPISSPLQKKEVVYSSESSADFLENVQQQKKGGALFSNLLESVLTKTEGEVTNKSLSEQMDINSDFVDQLADDELVSEFVDNELLDELKSNEFINELTDDELVSEFVDNELVDELDRSDSVLEYLGVNEFDERRDNTENKIINLQPTMKQTDVPPTSSAANMQEQISVNNSKPLGFSEALQQPTNILAQIEDAQKINTQVNDLQKLPQSSTGKTELLNEVVKGQDEANKIDSKILFKSENITLDKSESDNDKVLMEDPRKTALTPKASEKLEQFLSVNSMERAPVATMAESNLLRPSNAIASENSKLSGQPQSMPAAPAPATALHDPLALQSKQSAALLGERVLMMLSQDKQEIQIRLDPAELGSMNIKLQIQHDQVQLTIQTQAGQTRDLIEQNLPRLREQLAQQGVNLGEANIEQQNQQQKQHNQDQHALAQPSNRPTSEHSLAAIDESEAWLSRKITLPAQGIDYYA